MSYPNAASSSDRPLEPSFGSSIAKTSNKSSSSSSSHRQPSTMSYNSYIKPATPGAFSKSHGASRDVLHPQPKSSPFRPWPLGVTSHNSRPHQPHTGRPAAEEDGEVYDLRTANITAEDMQVYHGDAEKHMRELLSGAIGDDDAVEEGSDVIEGFNEGVRLMPHQVRGVQWMKKRETGRNTGGILADDMGLGKTVQVLARLVEGPASAAQRKAGYTATLVVAPVAVMEQWVGEVKAKTRSLKVTTHHGPTRAKLGAKLAKYDVVITTFQTLASEHAKYVKAKEAKLDEGGEGFGSSEDEDVGKAKVGRGKAKETHALFDVKWLRVVIDEAQNIKNHNTKGAKAACGLQAKYRWCLSGTPIQNRVEELYSLFHFLRIRPLSEWETFKNQIIKPMKQGKTKFAMKRLSVLLKAVMLRRTKDATVDGAPILKLPGRTVNLVECEFDAIERTFYEEVEQRMKDKLDKLQKTEGANTYVSVLTLLLRLRQACLHPSLVGLGKVDLEGEGMATGKPDEVQEDEQDDEADELAGMFGSLAVDHNKPKIEAADQARDASADQERESAKMRMLLKLLRDIESRGEGEKTIVFSQFTGFLDILGPYLKSHGIRFVRYDGSMKNDLRQQSLDTIKTSTSVRVILISFKAGSTGLNLTCCNNVVLMDLWWNPALEDQAFDRAHRLGQQRDVNIFKLIVEQTVEDRILALQETKRQLAKAALSGDAAGNFAKLTMADMLNLFRSHGTVDEEEVGDSDSD